LDGILEGRGRLGFWINTLDDPLLALGLMFMGLAFIKTKQERNALIAAQAQEINERKQLHTLLYAQAYGDELTGLGNRRALFERFVTSETPGHLLYIDLNQFKRVNDQKGHDVGDRVLQACAALLQAVPGLAYRIGGDEFVLILPNLSKAECAEVIEQLHQAVLPLHAEYGISFSIGQALITGKKRETLDALLAQADSKMYLEKQKYRQQQRHA
jgi:diguanylate cyclase (GGDEF)-like protein